MKIDRQRNYHPGVHAYKIQWMLRIGNTDKKRGDLPDPSQEDPDSAETPASPACSEKGGYSGVFPF